MDSREVLSQHQLSLRMRPIGPKELLVLDKAPGPVYAYLDELFKEIIPSGQSITKDALKSFWLKGVRQFFISHEDYTSVISAMKQALILGTRSLSVGAPEEKGPASMNALSMSLATLYDDPMATETIAVQFQGIKTFSGFAWANADLIRQFYTDFLRQNHHYSIQQPMLTSILLLGFLQKNKLFSEADSYKLFASSYFKDVGMALIPRPKLDLAQLSEDDQRLLLAHPQNSVRLLKDTLPVKDDQLALIANHHLVSGQYLKRVSSSEVSEDTTPTLYGFETVLISIMDMIVAMTCERPYRSRLTLFEALERIRLALGDAYSQEFKLLVYFFRDFFK